MRASTDVAEKIKVAKNRARIDKSQQMIKRQAEASERRNALVEDRRKRASSRLRAAVITTESTTDSRIAEMKIQKSQKMQPCDVRLSSMPEQKRLRTKDAKSPRQREHGVSRSLEDLERALAEAEARREDINEVNKQRARAARATLECNGDRIGASELDIVKTEEMLERSITNAALRRSEHLCKISKRASELSRSFDSNGDDDQKLARSRCVSESGKREHNIQTGIRKRA